jgi:imidazolonepropionase
VTSLALTGIGVLATCERAGGRGRLGLVRDAALVCENGVVVYAGPASGAPSSTDRVFDVGGRCVLPGFVDSHTHLVFAGERSDEFAQRMSGRPYHPGGILETVAATRAASTFELERNAASLVAEARASGTTSIEIKSGYGLDPANEARHLAIAGTLTDETTFLGAHIVPPEYAADRAGYLRLLTETMIPAAAADARWCDVFCEAGAFDAEESRTVLETAKRAGMGLRVHANQLGPGPGVRLACELGAASADHCTHLTPSDIGALAESGTVATILPISDFCTRQPYADGRALLDAGAVVALASNCNPGSSYSTSIPLAMALAVRECGLSVEEAILAATVGGAAALRRDDVGRLKEGSKADAVVVDGPNPEHLVYRLGVTMAYGVIKDGAWSPSR